MNTKNIEPVSIWTPNGQKNATILSLSNFFNYHFDNGSGVVEYILLGMESVGSQTMEDGTVVPNPESAVQYYLAHLEVPANIIQQWGASDDVIWDYVATRLELVFV